MEPQIGFTVITSSELRFFVATVSPDSPAQEAGLQTGDEILEVNGEKVTLEYIKTAAKLPPHKVGDVAVIKIQRKGEDKPREFRLVYRLLK